VGYDLAIVGLAPRLALAVYEPTPVVEMGADGKMTVLRQGTNHWVWVPANENSSERPTCAPIRWACSG